MQNALHEFWDKSSGFEAREPQSLRVLLLEHLDNLLEDETIAQELLDRATIDRTRAQQEDITTDETIELLFKYHNVDGRNQWRISAHGKVFYTPERSLGFLSLRGDGILTKFRKLQK